MPGDTHLKLLCVVTFLCTLNTEAYSGYVSLALPNRRSNADYFTKCDFGSDLASLCDWTTDGLGTQMGTAEVNIPSQDIHPAFHLKSGLLNISVDSCLEFWYHKPSQKSAELKVFLAEGIQQTLLWSSDSAVNGDWRQVFVPLTAHPDESAQVIFELSQGLQKYDEPAFNRIGIRRGQCGIQCQPGAEFWPDETTLCTCTDKQLTCAHIPPSKDSGFGTCHVASDPHYTTFDGVSFHFEGPCTYILSRVCDKSELLPEFSVEVRNEKRGDLPVASVQQVNIIMEGLRVAMLRRERSRVMVNGIWMNLPLHLKGNAVIIEAQGDVVALHTDFQMSVLYTRSGTVQVTLPSSYSNRVCGMCGNFNQLTEDEFMDPNGSQVEDGRILGERWLADAECKDPIPPRVCTEPEEKEYASDHYCGVLTSRQGPFAECSSVLNIDNFLQSCMFHMCTTEGDPEALCNTIQTFIDACNKAGITVSAWRNSTFCPLVCGPQSHYNACASGCHDICSSLDTAGGCGICEERCECDDGFLVSGGTCVPAEDCGCWVNEQHYAIRETYMEANCERLCECLGNGNIRCSPVSCLPDEVCSVKDGVVGCFPSNPVTCRVYGDPHYITFDGKAYSFWGTCNYTIAKTCGPTVNQFAITARNEGRENSATSSLNSVALDMEGFHLTIRKNKLVHVNGNPVNLPADFGIFRLSQSGPYAQLDTSFGLRLLFDGKQRLFVQVDERYTGMMCGLCGTYSGSQFDDFLTPDGNTVAHPHEFGSSWDTHDTDWPCSNGSPDPPPCDPDLENVAFKECSALFSDVFAECHWFVPPQIYVTSCISDYCTYQGDKSQLCNSLEDYVSACQLAEVFLTHWRNHTSCDLDPPPQPTDESKPTSSSESCTWSCNFDQGECGWQQLIQDSFDWTRWSGSTPSDLTGPTNDHTTGNGFYMYIEGDSVVQGDSARIMSPACYASGKQCVKFWYHMYGQANAMALNIYLFENKRALKIWSKANNQGNHWLQGSVEIKPQEPFQIIVEGIRGSDPRSDVAIDDLVIFYGGCDDTSIEDQDSTTLVPPLSTSNSINPHPVCSLNCNFERDICGWTQTPTDVFDWSRHTGSTPSLMTGPSSDHTTGSGFYMYIEGDSASYGDTARIISSECADIQNQCLQFWYHMYGSGNTMGLSVYHLQGNVAKEVWKKRENQGNMWYRALVDLTPTGKFQVIFEGRRGSTSLSDVSIDDVSLHRGTCNDLINHVSTSPPVSLPPTTSPCPKNSHYTDCIHTCQPTCSHLHGPPNCNTEEPCVPGCVCDDGFVLKQGVCVPIHECGCVDSNGDIHDFGDVWYDGHCSQRCKCEDDDGGEIECEDHECDEDEICHMNEEGDYSCQDTEFSKCTIDDKPEYKTFDSMKHKFKGKESYVLAQSSGLPSNIPEVYVVSINKKTKGESSEEGMSSGMGRGKSSEEDKSSNKSSKEDSSSEENKSSEEDSSSEENKSSKEDSSSEENKSSKEDSSSEEDNNNNGRIRVIRIRAYNRTVDFKKDLKITVDGLSVRPPISPTKGMKIYERSSRVFLKTDFGLTVEFNGKGRAEITLSHVYKKKIGGLCGNFDDSSKNDKMKPNGKQAKDVKEFGESWRVTDRRRRSAVLKKWLLR